MNSTWEVILENFVSYFLIGIIIIFVLYFYLRSKRKNSKKNQAKLNKAIELGFHEPVSLHPVINSEICIGSGACVAACPERDILGLMNGRGVTINASRCVGHGACFHACPVEAITLVMGTEKRGVELPHVSAGYESNIGGVYIAGELGGMGLIKNAVEQGRLAMESIVRSLKKSHSAEYDVIIVGAGPAGISASLTASKNKIKFITLEQDSLGGTVFSFPRAKIVMTSPMQLDLYGKVKLSETTKAELLSLWKEVLTGNDININENEKVNEIERGSEFITVRTLNTVYTTANVLLAIGRRGTPRKLGVPGEEKEKVYYRLLEPELIKNKNVLVVGGGDSAIESALLLVDEGNNVKLSYRGDSFNRIKPRNLELLNAASDEKKIEVIYNSSVKEITDNSVAIKINDEKIIEIENDLVYVFAGGELPNAFLQKVGIKITKKFGEVILKHT
ncbi:MAG: NAD(P)-binding domain-containing protein [bacterium]